MFEPLAAMSDFTVMVWIQQVIHFFYTEKFAENCCRLYLDKKTQSGRKLILAFKTQKKKKMDFGGTGIPLSQSTNIYSFIPV